MKRGEGEEDERKSHARSSGRTSRNNARNAVLICSDKQYRSRCKKEITARALTHRASRIASRKGDRGTHQSLKRLDPSTSPSLILVAMAQTGR